jgi:hypothetical protein
MQYHIFDYRGEAKHVAAVTVDPTGDNLPDIGERTGTWRFARSIHPSTVPAITTMRDAKDRLDSEGFVLISENEIAWRE